MTTNLREHVVGCRVAKRLDSREYKFALGRKPVTLRTEQTLPVFSIGSEGLATVGRACYTTTGLDVSPDCLD